MKKHEHDLLGTQKNTFKLSEIKDRKIKEYFKAQKMTIVA